VQPTLGEARQSRCASDDSLALTAAISRTVSAGWKATASHEGTLVLGQVFAVTQADQYLRVIFAIEQCAEDALTGGARNV
jgi:hypothetical protein